MLLSIYLLILAYFVAGAVAFLFINRRRSLDEARRNWLKYGTYFLIIHVLFASIVFDSRVFHYLSLGIILAGYVELVLVFRKSGHGKPGVFVPALILYTLLSVGFYRFGLLSREEILFCFLVVCAFDAFSQLTGQLLGRRKIAPTISPAKTLEGLIGGVCFGLATAVLLRTLPGRSATGALGVGLGIVALSLAGDLLASYYKRQYGVKDYSRALPGQGGFLDRFDSLIAAGAFVALLASLPR